MADNMGTWNKLTWAGEMDDYLIISDTSADVVLPSITLPAIANATIVMARLRFIANWFVGSSENIDGDQYIQIKKGAGGTFANAIKIVDGAFDVYSGGVMPHVVIDGSIDVTGTVDSFNQEYPLQWDDALITGQEAQINIHDYHLELDVWFTIDSGVEAKIDAIETDTGTTLPATLTGIENKIDTIDTEVGVIDGIVDDIKESLIVGSGSVGADGSTTVFQTNLADADDYWNNQQILFTSSVNNELQVRRISDFVNVNGVITVSEPMNDIAKSGDTFIIIGRWAGAGTSLTDQSIATKVWEEALPGSFGAGTAGKQLADVEDDTVDMQPRVAAIEIDTNEMQGKLPSSAYLKGTADADGGMDTADKADVNAEVDSALNTAIPGGPTADSINERIVTMDTNIDQSLSTTESNIRGTDGDDLKDISDQIDTVNGVVDDLYDGKIISEGTVSADISLTSFKTNLPEDDDHWNGLLIAMWDTAINASQVRRIVDFVSDDGVVTVDKAFEIEPDAGDSFFLLTDYSALEDHDVDMKALVGTPVTDVSTDIASNLTAIGVVEGKVDTIDSEVGVIDGNVDLVLEDTADMQPRVVDIETDATAILEDTSTTIPLQITTHDTDIKGLPNIKATPKFLVVPYGVSRINVEGGITAIQTSIPIYDSSQFEDVGIVFMGTELVSYTGISDGSLTGCTRGYNSTTPAVHADQAAVYNVVSYPLRLMVFDNEGNMKAPDSAPTIEIDDWAGTQEIAPVAMTLLSTGLYGYNYLVYQTDLPEPKVVKYSIIVDGITTKRQSTLMMLDKPASTTDLIALVGGGNGEFSVTQDGWYDNDGIFTAWTDVMVGYLRDATSGSRLDDVLVTAYEVINGKTIRAIIPPAQTVCGVNGTYEMRLDSGTYVFKFKKDQYRFPTDEVTRVIT